MPPLFPAREGDRPRLKKKEDMLDRHIMGNIRQSMMLNFNVNFLTFLKMH